MFIIALFNFHICIINYAAVFVFIWFQTSIQILTFYKNLSFSRKNENWRLSVFLLVERYIIVPAAEEWNKNRRERGKTMRDRE